MSPFRYLLQGYRVRPAKSSPLNHWQGGPPQHRGARCPECRRPFLLTWDINLRDPAFLNEPEPVFSGMRRLPLYYCWRCSIDFSYRLVAPDRVKIVEYTGSDQGDKFPYADYPEAYPRVPIVLVPIPPRMQKLLFIFQEMPDWIDRKELKEIGDWLGFKTTRHTSPLRHQFGGAPYLIQGHLDEPCMNPKCHRFEDEEQPMKELAVLHNDPDSGLPLIDKDGRNPFVQVVYHICPICLTIHARNQCD